MTNPRKNIQRKKKINAKMVRNANKGISRIANGETITKVYVNHKVVSSKTEKTHPEVASYVKDVRIRKASGITPFFTGIKALKKSIKEREAA